MEVQECARLDPRIRRTRDLLQNALRRLLQEKEFDKISVQDITEAATLNRATFYAHYPDKFALLGEFVRVSFLHLLEQRHVRFDGTCSSAFQVIILAVCDYLLEVQSSLSSKQHQFEPFLEATVIDQIRLVLLDGFLRSRKTMGTQPRPRVARRIRPSSRRASPPNHHGRSTPSNQQLIAISFPLPVANFFVPPRFRRLSPMPTREAG
jgi:AcrR family transcriptional regulator